MAFRETRFSRPVRMIPGAAVSDHLKASSDNACSPWEPCPETFFLRYPSLPQALEASGDHARIGFVIMPWFLGAGCTTSSVSRACARAYAVRPEQCFEPGGQLVEQVERAKRWRDAAKAHRDEIESIRTRMRMLGMVASSGGGNVASITADLRKAIERIKELENENAERQAKA
jgi:hypothetical protein